MDKLIDFDFSERQVLGIKEVLLDRVRAALVPELDEIQQLVDQLITVPKKLDTLKARVDAIARQTTINVTDIANISNELGTFERLSTIWGNIGNRDCFDNGYFSKKVSAVLPVQQVVIGFTTGTSGSLGKSLQVVRELPGEIAPGLPVAVNITPFKSSMREIIGAQENSLWCRLGFMAKRLDDIGLKVGALREGILPDDVVASIQSDWGSVLGFLDALDSNGYTPREFVSRSVGAIEIKGAWRDRLLETIRGEIPEFDLPEFNLASGLNAITVPNLEPGGTLGTFGSVLKDFIGVTNIGPFKTGTCDENTVWGALRCRLNDITELRGFFFELVGTFGNTLGDAVISIGNNRDFLERRRFELAGEGGIIENLNDATTNMRGHSLNITETLDRDTYRFYWYRAERDVPLELKTKIQYGMDILPLEGNEDLTVEDVLPAVNELKLKVFVGGPGWSVTTQTSDTTGLLSLIRDGAGVVTKDLLDWIGGFSAETLGVGIGEAKREALRYVTQTTRSFMDGEVRAQIRQPAREITGIANTRIFRDRAPEGVLPRLNELDASLGILNGNLGIINDNALGLESEVTGIRNRIEELGWAPP